MAYSVVMLGCIAYRDAMVGMMDYAAIFKGGKYVATVQRQHSYPNIDWEHAYHAFRCTDDIVRYCGDNRDMGIFIPLPR